jgi:hypothetical protein
MKTLSVLYAIVALAFASSALAAPDAVKTAPTSSTSGASTTAPPDCGASSQDHGPRQTVSAARADSGKSAMDDWSARCASSHAGAQPQASPPASVGVPVLDAGAKDAAK